MTWMTALVPLAALLIGIVSAMTGIGGGSLMVPLMVLLLDIPAHEAVGTSLTTIILTAISSSLAYSRQRRIDYKVAALMTIGTVPGSVVGAYITKYISPGGLIGLFGGFLLIVAIRMIYSGARGGRAPRRRPVRAGSWHRKIVDSSGEVFEYNANARLGAPLATSGGLVSGFLGVGGGVLMVPILTLVVGLPIHLAVAASMFIMIFTSSFGATTHILLGNVLPLYVVLLGIGITIGAQVGARIAKRIRPTFLKMTFGFVVAFAGLRMVLKAI